MARSDHIPRLLVLAASVAGYLFLTYVILEIVGIRLGLPWEAWWN